MLLLKRSGRLVSVAALAAGSGCAAHRPAPAPSPTSTPPPLIAVVVFAPDAADAADLEVALEVRLRSVGGVRVMPADDVAAAFNSPASRDTIKQGTSEALQTIRQIGAAGQKILSSVAGGAPTPEPTPFNETAERADKLWQDAHRAYVEADYQTALKLLGQVLPLADHLPAAMRTRTHELAAAVRSKLKDEPGARQEATNALVTSGDLPADLADYPPSVRRIFEEALARLARATLTLSPVPAGAEVFIDDRPLSGVSVRLPCGSHRLRVSARGFRATERDIALARDRVVPLTLAPQLEPDTERLLASLVDDQVPVSETMNSGLFSLANRLGVEELVVAVRLGGELRTAIYFNRTSDPVMRLGSSASPSAAADQIAAGVSKPASG